MHHSPSPHSSAPQDSARRSPSALLRRPAAEFNVSEHCNLNCAFCDHASPLLPERFAEPESLARDLRALAAVLHVRELKLLGGEPLWHPQLFELIEIARASGFCDTLTVVTNGVLLHRVDLERLLGAIDKLWISRYPGVRIRVDLDELRARARAFGTELFVRDVREFRQTLLRGEHQDPALRDEIYASCALAHRWSCHTIRDGYYYKCPPAALAEPIAAATEATSSWHQGRDGVALHDNPDLAGALRAYLASPEPLETCERCLGSSGRLRAHHQLDRPGIEDARAARDDAADCVQLKARQSLRLAWRRFRARGAR